MRIGWYDHGLFHQSSAIPNLPPPEATWGIYGGKAHLHSRVNVVGMEMWRTPLIHRILDHGDELVWLTRRKVDPSPDLDQDLARLAEAYPEFQSYVREHDPCLNEDQFLIWPVRTHLNQHYFTDQSTLFKEASAPTTEMLRYWVKEEVLGVPPDIDVFVCAVMRADEATAFEVGYFTGIYLNRGVPVVLWDQDHQLSGMVATFKRLGFEWPNPLVTVIGPYDEATSHNTHPLTIDYPYVTAFEQEPVEVRDRIGAVYVGNDYGRREAMERLLLSLAPRGVPVTVWGRYDAKDGPEWIAKHPEVHWAGRIPSNQVPGMVMQGHFTVNIVKHDYVPIGLLTLRTFDANCYGTIQIGDRRIKRLAQYVPDKFLVETTGEAVRLAQEIMSYNDDQYREALEQQRTLTRRNDLDAFTERFYEILAVATAGRENGSYMPLREVPPPQQHQPGKLCTSTDERLEVGHYWHGDPGWTPEWKENKEEAKP